MSRSQQLQSAYNDYIDEFPNKGRWELRAGALQPSRVDKLSDRTAREVQNNMYNRNGIWKLAKNGVELPILVVSKFGEVFLNAYDANTGGLAVFKDNFANAWAGVRKADLDFLVKEVKKIDQDLSFGPASRKHLQAKDDNDEVGDEGVEDTNEPLKNTGTSKIKSDKQSPAKAALIPPKTSDRDQVRRNAVEAVGTFNQEELVKFFGDLVPHRGYSGLISSMALATITSRPTHPEFGDYQKRLEEQFPSEENAAEVERKRAEKEARKSEKRKADEAEMVEKARAEREAQAERNARNEALYGVGQIR